MPILVTGAAGFIGFHVAKQLLTQGETVWGIDNLNPYYDVRLKEDRLQQLTTDPNFTFTRMDLCDQAAMEHLFTEGKFSGVIHLAAQAGVRHSMHNPHIYAESNVLGFVNILEGCRHTQVPHLVYASSSSVYGLNAQQPFSEHHGVDHPMSLYAATKRANELMAHTYAHLYQLPTTGLRFFTAYGPWGRPDMALFKFTRSILADEPIEIYNHGQMVRDFTYVDDIAAGVLNVLRHPAMPNSDWTAHKPDPASSQAPYRLYNIGNSQPVPLMEFIHALESAIGKPAIKQFLPMQPGDVPATHADVSELQQAVDFKPRTSVQEGIRRFVEWYRGYYGV